MVDTSRQQIIQNLNHSLDSWLKALDDYNFDVLCKKPTAESWSLGQVYMHLIHNSWHYIDQIKICLTTNDHESDQPSDNARAILHNNELPDAFIQGPASNALTPQPQSKDELVYGLIRIKEEFNDLSPLVATTTFRGKAKHPGLNYFNAIEWLQFADMHFRHHLRQKKRIDDFLEKSDRTPS
jgi:hypothetical protein